MTPLPSKSTAERRWTLKGGETDAGTSYLTAKGPAISPWAAAVQVMPVSEHNAEVVELAKTAARTAAEEMTETINEHALYRRTLEAIRDREWVENALDPQWAARMARAALAPAHDNQEER